MALNYIWIALFAIGVIIGLVKLIFFGDMDTLPEMMDSTFKMSTTAFEMTLGLTGTLTLWMGILKIGEDSGLVNRLAKFLSPVLTKLFPEIPKNHPALGSIFMNVSANMLGLDNAATPVGLKAMQELQSINTKKDTASNSMIMFLTLNTSGLTIIPVSIMAYRAKYGAADPADIFIPLLLTTLCSTIVGLTVVSIYQRINLFQPVLLAVLGGMSLFVAALIWGVGQLSSASLDLWGTNVANILLFSIITMFLVSGMRAKINVYDAFIEGAKDGFQTAVRIIPYLIAILVSIGVFRASGAMDWLVEEMKWLISLVGIDTQWVGALPTALMKPLSGGGARGMMVDAMTTFGADSFVGRLSCIFQGSTDTTFYILAVYFGSVGVTRTRHAVACGLLADLAGVIAAILLCYLFF